jgi:AraC-like DNA-binding protein
MKAGYYGDRTAQGDRAEIAHAFLTRLGDQPPIAMSRIRLLDVQPEPTSLPMEDAVVFTLCVGGRVEREMLLNGGSSPRSTPVPEGSCSFVDLRDRARLRLRSHLDIVQFYLPLRSLDGAVDEGGSGRIDTLRIASGDVLTDATLCSLGAAMKGAFLRPQEADKLFIEHVGRAAACYVAKKFGEARQGGHRRGGLATWQENRAKQMIEAQLHGGVSLDILASECGLSTSHFIRAFRNSVGVAPHQWLMRRRIDKALDLMRDRSRSLSEIALACGFADQSHFTRSFTAALGESPSAYRRASGAAATVESGL